MTENIEEVKRKMKTTYYTYLEKGNYRRIYGDLFLCIYSRSKIRLIQWLDKKFERERWIDRHRYGSIVKERRPIWYKYKKILGV